MVPIQDPEKGVADSYDSITRVKAALTHREADRVPLDVGGTRVTGIHIQAYHEYRRRLGLPPSQPVWQVRYLQLPKVEQDFRDLIGVDLESVDPVTAVEETEIVAAEGGGWSYTDRWGCEWFMPEGGAYFDIRQFPLADADSEADLEQYAWPREDSLAMLENLTGEAKVIWTEHRRAVVLGRTCPGIFEMLAILCGYEKAYLHLAMNPSFCEAVMDRILECKLTYYRAAIDRLLAAGLKYFIIGESDDLGAQDALLISPDMYRRMVKPWHTELFKFIKEYSQGRAFIELHSDGAIRELLPDFIESGVEIINPLQLSAAGMDDTHALKDEFGDALVFHGGAVDTQTTLARGTPQQVRDEVRRHMDDLAPGGGFIFTPVHSIQHDVPFANFVAMIEAYREYAG